MITHTATNLNELAKEIHIANIYWWQDLHTGQPIKRNKRELLALAVSELSECLEGVRKDLMDDHLPHRKMAEVELADTVIRLLDPRVLIPHTKGEGIFNLMEAVVACGRGDKYVIRAIRQIEDFCEKWEYDLVAATEEKRAYNRTREDHKHETRRIAGGKQF